MSEGRLHQRVCSLNGKMVYVRDHTYLDNEYHRLSNWVTYSMVGSDGTVQAERFGDYDKGQFIPLVKTVKIVVMDWNGVGDP